MTCLTDGHPGVSGGGVLESQRRARRHPDRPDAGRLPLLVHPPAAAGDVQEDPALQRLDRGASPRRDPGHRRRSRGPHAPLRSGGSPAAHLQLTGPERRLHRLFVGGAFRPRLFASSAVPPASSSSPLQTLAPSACRTAGPVRRRQALHVATPVSLVVRVLVALPVVQRLHEPASARCAGAEARARRRR